jgi:hypothetical protein
MRSPFLLFARIVYHPLRVSILEFFSDSFRTYVHATACGQVIHAFQDLGMFVDQLFEEAMKWISTHRPTCQSEILVSVNLRHSIIDQIVQQSCTTGLTFKFYNAQISSQVESVMYTLLFQDSIRDFSFFFLREAKQTCTKTQQGVTNTPDLVAFGILQKGIFSSFAVPTQ